MRAAELLPSVHKLGNNYQTVILGLATQTTFAFCLYVWLAGGGGGGGGGGGVKYLLNRKVDKTS